jgi:hypothetical protein
MSLYSRIAGVINSFFQFGGPAGPGINANGAALETKNAANNAFAVHRGATPVADNDLTTKAYVDTIARPFIVTAQSNAASALIANSGVEHYIVVSAAGTGAAAAYVAGAVLWDDGSGSGNVTILGPTAGQPIFVTTSLTGGTFVFSANNEYIWTGTTWQSVTPSLSGIVYCIDFALALATASSVTQIPANAVILSCELKVTTAYSAGTTIAVGQTGTTGLLMATGDNVATTIDEYRADQRTGWGASPLAVLATIAGSPSVGAGTVTVQYTLPNS